MSWKMFGQAAALIAVFFFAYWLLLKVRDREMSAPYLAAANAADANAAAAEENLRRIQAGGYTLMSNDITTADLQAAENSVNSVR